LYTSLNDNYQINEEHKRFLSRGQDIYDLYYSVVQTTGWCGSLPGYLLVQQGMSQRDASAACNVLGSHLAAIRSAAENVTVTNYLQTTGYTNWVHLGANDSAVEEGMFVKQGMGRRSTAGWNRRKLLYDKI